MYGKVKLCLRIKIPESLHNLALLADSETHVSCQSLGRFADSPSRLNYVAIPMQSHLTLSNDGPFANKAFAEKNEISFPVLGDYTSNTIKDYGVLMPDLLHIKGYNAAKRSVFIVTKDGKIGYKWVSEDPLKEPDYAKIREFLSANKA